MENEPEVIRKEMQDTRTSLQEKLEALSQQVTGTVHDARAAMMETVDTFRGVVTDTVSTVKDQVTGTVSSVKEQFTSTVDGAKEQFTGAMDGVKQSFDIEHHVMTHPLAMVGGAVALGYIGGMVLNRIGSSPHARALPVPAERGEKASRSASAPQSAYQPSTAMTAPEGALPGFMKSFEPEITKLKGVAIGALFGVLRDLVQQNLPQNLNQPVMRVVDDLTTKMGGEPVEGHMLKQ